ncbi:MAG: hypothetical protein ACHQ1H_08090, partial [Nitrososphaerales archaeon]
HLILKDRFVADIDLTNPFSENAKQFFSRSGAFTERRRDTAKHTGVMGDPFAASEEKGRKILEAATKNLERIIREYHSLPDREYLEFGSYNPE